MSEYIEKRWSKEVLEKRLQNLKKVINPYFVDSEIANGRSLAEDELDALYIAYFNLKDRFCKINRSSFGKPKQVGYVPKKKPIGYYSKYWDNDDEWTWKISSSTYTTSSVIYTCNADGAWNMSSTTTILNR